MDKSSSKDLSPSPTNFVAFFPWACRRLDVEIVPIITTVKQNENLSDSTKLRLKEEKGKIQQEITMEVNLVPESSMNNNFGIKYNAAICNIQATYDSKDNLVQIKFHKNSNVSREMLQIISLILQFYKYLTAIHINGGLKHDGLYELEKIVTSSNITEVILDNTVLQGARFYSLLEHKSPLKYLSLARCKLMDDDVKEIANRLVHPLAASKTLSVLNLSSNRITDAGVKFLGDMLRTNRQLAYLNLSSNMITDTGADSIFNNLVQFPLTTDELRVMKTRHITYLKQIFKKKNEKTYSTPVDKKIAKKKASKPVPLTGNKSKPGNLDKAILTVFNPDTKIESLDDDESTFDTSEPFKDPFRPEETYTLNEVMYCLGNNTLCYLNLAYNNLSYFSVKKLYNVLSAQYNQGRSPKGLVNFCIEGNNIPEFCTEMKQIKDILRMGLDSAFRLHVPRRTTVAKATSKQSTY